jgi:predicted Zn-dependent protease
VSPSRYDGHQRRSRGGFRLLPILLFGLYALYYYFSNQQTVPVTGRRQLVDLNREQEAALGVQSYQQVLRTSQVLHSGQAVDAVRSIGQRIARVADDPGFKWEFNVIQSDQANAFCLPGGKVAVYTGILPVAKNDSGLAVIMGHEIAHAIARHGAERMAHQKLVQIGTLAAGVAISDMDPQQQRMVLGALGVGAQFGVLLPFSRDHESEADHIGLLYAAKACFDPAEAPKLWERMGQPSGGRGPAEWQSTHPSHETRIRQLNDLMPEALKLRQQNCGK